MLVKGVILIQGAAGLIGAGRPLGATCSTIGSSDGGRLARRVGSCDAALTGLSTGASVVGRGCTILVATARDRLALSVGWDAIQTRCRGLGKHKYRTNGYKDESRIASDFIDGS